MVFEKFGRFSLQSTQVHVTDFKSADDKPEKCLTFSDICRQIYYYIIVFYADTQQPCSR